MDEHLSPEEQEILRERTQAATLAANQLRDDIRQLMGTKSGRRVTWDLLARAGIFLSSFSTDALAMAHREGRRSLGLEYLALISLHCPEQYDKMMAENRTKPATGNNGT